MVEVMVATQCRLAGILDQLANQLDEESLAAIDVVLPTKSLSSWSFEHRGTPRGLDTQRTQCH
jgi:hypothetical protein